MAVVQNDIVLIRWPHCPFTRLVFNRTHLLYIIFICSLFVIKTLSKTYKDGLKALRHFFVVVKFVQKTQVVGKRKSLTNKDHNEEKP